MTMFETTEIFAVDLAALAREIAMDILPLGDVLRLHQLDDDEWAKIQAHPKFQSMIASMSRDWQSATNVPERVKAKAASAIEGQLEVYVRAISDESIPLIQRVEAGKFLARLGELGERAMGAAGERFTITLNIGQQAPITAEVRTPKIIDGILPEAETD